MLKRDFNKSNKEYFRNNRNILIAIGIFLLVGILVFAIFGMNGNFEIRGYNEFSINVTEKTTEDYSKHRDEIGSIINSFNGKFDNMLIYGEGDDTKYVVRYISDVNNKKVLEINKLVAEEVGVDIADISEHVKVGPVVKNTDYIFTAVAILLLIVIATIFTYARYNGASAMSIIIGCLLGTMGYISLGSILQISIGMSYFAMLVILNLLMIYFAIELFESMHRSSWLASQDYATALGTALKSSKFRMVFVTVGTLAIGLLLVLFAPLTIKYIAINLMFMAVTILAVGLYVIPFVWNVFITRCRKREYKIKASAVEDAKNSK